MDLAGGKGPRIYQSKYLTDLLLLDARDEENDTISRLIIQPLLGLRRIFELRVKVWMSCVNESCISKCASIADAFI